ncbi:HlyD family type I secretion periplasmic adaptor subunit [Synechococcus sp. Cu2B8-bc1011]|uniref:HlyD family type I secretion periplasmic adaptor subunit n=1 Tax=Synechococcus sp. Cu2B8-bc1011 TaxID=3093725 RepID=UPI0039AF6B64
MTDPLVKAEASLWQMQAEETDQAFGHGRRAEALSLESGQVPPNLSRWLLGATAVMAGSVLVSALVPIQNYVVASGEIEPAGEIQKVQHLEGGLIRDQLVEEGEKVRRGDVLLTLSEGQIGSQQQQTATRITNLTLEQRELRKALGQEALNLDLPTPSSPSAEVERAFADLLEQKGLDIQRQIKIGDQRLKTLQAKRKEYLDEVALLKEQTNSYAFLENAGAISHNDVLEAERRIASTETMLAELDGTILETQTQRFELRSKLRTDILEQLADVTSEKAELQSVLGEQLDEVRRLQVRSPVDGIVKSYTVKTIGGVIAPGSVVAEVVPLGDQLEGFLRVKPSDIGNVQRGQRAELKVLAYDYSRYGTISGVVRSISAGTFQDEKTGEPYYKVRASLSRDYAGQNEGRNLLVPGMTLTADILTDRTNLLMYLLGPIRRGFGDAMQQ